VVENRIIGRKVLRYEQVESTNTLVREYAERGEPEGLVIAAEEQVAGRGRMGRKWIVPRGTSLQFSVLLRPPLEPRHASRLMPMAALAIAQTLERELHLQPMLKWPNDVLLDGKKVSGILTEASMQGDELVYVILGIGLNVNYSMRNYPDLAPFATTLQDALGRAVDRVELERALFAKLDRYYARVRRGETLVDEYRSRLGMLGQPLRVANGDKILEGIAQDVDDDGALILLQGDSRVKLCAGDVTVLKELKEAV
jgi:BirA family biotin operon repressor/biotin-[acetyl-CoA-carboxylase] ligase